MKDAGQIVNPVSQVGQPSRTGLNKPDTARAWLIEWDNQNSDKGCGSSFSILISGTTVLHKTSLLGVFHSAGGQVYLISTCQDSITLLLKGLSLRCQTQPAGRIRCREGELREDLGLANLEVTEAFRVHKTIYSSQAQRIPGLTKLKKNVVVGVGRPRALSHS